jgi:hypothetical protein
MTDHGVLSAHYVVVLFQGGDLASLVVGVSSVEVLVSRSAIARIL